MTIRTLRWLARRLLPVAALVTLAACTIQSKQSALDPEGPIARQSHNLFRPVFWIAAAIFVLVETLIVIVMVRFRDRGQADEPKQIHGNSRLELAWTIAPALLLAVIAVPTVLTIFDQAATAKPDQLHVRVVGHQWWWEYQYSDFAPQVVTANELVIPTGKEVFLELESADVIHSFWVPKLAGKQDVVPGRINTMMLVADEPGEFYGQCAEFCSVAHADMRLRVFAKSPADFDTWLKDQQQPGAEPTSSDAIEGRKLFLSNACVGCHTIGGTPAAGKQGPDLTHFGSRKTFAAAIEDVTPDAVFRWIRNPLKIKPGVIMPAFGKAFGGALTDAQIRQIVAYLLALK